MYHQFSPVLQVEYHPQGRCCVCRRSSADVARAWVLPLLGHSSVARWGVYNLHHAQFLAHNSG
jgi:hypothetical protein